MSKFFLFILCVFGLLTTAVWFQSDVKIANLPFNTYETAIKDLYNSPTLEAKYYYVFVITSAILNKDAVSLEDRKTLLAEAYRYSKKIDEVAPAYKDNKRIFTFLTAAKKYARI